MDHTPEFLLTATEQRQQRYNLRLLVFCMAYTMLAGSVRKWMLQGGVFSNILLLGHILLPWMYYFLAAGTRRKYGRYLLMFGVVLLLMALNPLNQTVFHGIFGILLHLGFWLIGFHFLENRRLYPWQKLMGFLMFFFLLEIGLGIIQYSLPRDHFINRYAAEGATSIAYVGERARVTGTFSYVAGFSSWLFFANLWIWALALRQYSVRLVTVLTALAILASLISGARAVLAFTLVFTFFMYQAALRRTAAVRVVAIFLVGFLVTLAIYQNSTFLQEAWSNFYSRIEDGIRDQEFGRRTYGVLEEIVNYRGENPVFGAGLGATYQGARALWGESYFVKTYGGYEEEPERIILEGGFILFFLRLGMLVLFLQAMRFPLLYKCMFGLIILFFTHSIFNVYNIFFVPLGLSLLDWAYSESETGAS